MSAESRDRDALLIVTGTESFECGICMEVLYKATSCSPCLHTFCAGCISNWFKTNQYCPICTTPSSELLPNRQINELVKEFHKQNPGHDRSVMEKHALDKFELQYIQKALDENSENIRFLFQLREEEMIQKLMRECWEKQERLLSQKRKVLSPSTGCALH